MPHSSSWVRVPSLAFNMLKVMIFGNRSFDNDQMMKECLDAVLPREDILILSGGDMGAESMCQYYAVGKGIKFELHKAGSQLANAYRHERMLADADVAIGFWNGKDREVLQVIELAKSAGKLLDVFVFKPDDDFPF